MIKILMPISKDIEKKILWLRYKKRSWKDASQCEVDFYINSTIDISKELEKEGHNVSSVEVRKVIEKKLSRIRSLDWDDNAKRSEKSYVGISKFIKLQNGVELKHRKRIYLYWYKFLQLAIEEKKKIDWSKYEDWGNAKFVAKTKFDDWWKEHEPLFDLRTNKKLKYDCCMDKPRFETIWWSYEVYCLRKKEMTFYDIGQELGSLKKVQLRKEQNPITKDKETSEEDFINEYGDRKKNMIGELQYKDRRTLMRSMMRYNTRAERILNGVCQGRFPEERNW